MFKLLLNFALILPMFAFGQTSNTIGKWYVEIEDIDSNKKSTITLVKDSIVKQNSNWDETYMFNADGSFSTGSIGLFFATSADGNWSLLGSDQIVLNFILGETSVKRVFTLEQVNSVKIKLTEH